jgi:hypothetical protein
MVETATESEAENAIQDDCSGYSKYAQTAISLADTE